MILRRKAATVLGALGAVATLVVTLSACGGGPAGAQDNQLTVSFSQNIADELPLWIADEAGLFAKQGLDVKLTNLSSSNGFPALVAGQTQLASIGASEMVSGAASGAEVSYLATLTPVFPYQLYAKVRDPQQLKGKRIGVTSTSGSLYIATLTALQQLGLSQQDVHLVTLGSVTNVNNALVAGTIDAAMSHPPATTKIESAGYRPLLDLAKQRIPTSNVGIAATNEYLYGHRRQVTKFMTALRQGIHREKSDEPYAEKILAEHLKVSHKRTLRETWRYYAKEVLPDVPTPTTEQLATSKKALARSNPGVKSIDVATLVDASFLRAAK